MKNMLAEKNNEGLSLHAYPEISSNKITLKEFKSVEKIKASYSHQPSQTNK